jgi:type I restriction enzyme R subunit
MSDIPRVVFSERKTVQNPILKYAIDIGWQYLKGEEALDLRDGETGIFFLKILKEKLRDFNPWLFEEEIEEVIKELLERTRYNLEGNQKVLNYYRGQTPIFSKKENRELNVRFFDFENPQNNVFQVTDELTFTNGVSWNRFDLVFYVNGLPILIIETKNPEKEEGIEEALTQIRRYHSESPEFMVYPLLFVGSNLHEFVYGPTWNVQERYLYNWRQGNNLEEITKSFLDFKRILSFIEDYIIFWEEGGELKKIVLATHQIRAVEKIVNRVIDGKKHHGLIWHTQGSGKTLTMIVTAHKLRKLPILENPTLLIVVDRTELEEQMSKNLKNYGFPAVEITESKEKLKELLSSDYRGLIVTLIHKFDKIPEKLNERKNIIVFVDEAHRTQEGELGVYMRSALPNAFYFGFTGTPVDETKIGKGTFFTFGKDDLPQGYLDKYSILDSLRDKTTVPINYTLAPNEFLVPKELLEKEFYELVEKEATTSIEQLDKKILEKAVKLRTFLKSPERIKKVAKFVVEHFRNYVEPLGFKAFLVGVDREACALLKDELDKQGIIPPEYSKAVYTPAHNDSDLIKKYQVYENEEKEIKNNFLKVGELPKILVVTSKLLTGFDAPVLYVMYLDKPMNDHTLLQAIARVNRPLAAKELNNKKEYGLIVDFIGIFEKLEKALRFDSADIKGVVVNLEEKKKEFAELIREGKFYLDIVGEKIDDKAVERIIDYFDHDKKKIKKFTEFYERLSGLFEIISPDIFLRPYLDDYFLFSGIFKVIKTILAPKISSDLWKKTVKLVQEKVKVKGLTTTLPTYPIDEKAISLIQQDFSPERVKIVKTHRSIKILIEEEGPKEPFLYLFRERIEKILEEFEAKQIGTIETLKKLEDLIKEINDARLEKKKLGLSEKEFAYYFSLKDYIEEDEKRKEIAYKMNELFSQYSNWKENPEVGRKLRLKLFSLFASSIQKIDDISQLMIKRILPLQKEIETVKVNK